MRQRLQRLGRSGVIALVSWMVRCWHEAPPMPRATAAGLDIPLLPSPLARRVRQGFLGLQLLYGCELLLLGHLLVGPAVLALALLLLLRPGAGGRADARAPRRLLLAADGRLHLQTAGGRIEAARLHASSLRLGPWLLLRLATPGGACRLLLGPDNLAAPTLAALRRRLVLVDQTAEAVLPAHSWLVTGRPSRQTGVPAAPGPHDAAPHPPQEPDGIVR